MAPVSLLDLPTKLLLQITSYLRYPFHVALYMTCRLLHSTLPSPNTRPSPPNPGLYRQHFTNTRMYDILDLLHIEVWPCYNRVPQQPGPGDFFACSYCLKIRPAVLFSNGMMKGQYAKFRSMNVPLVDSYQDIVTLKIIFKLERFCIPCGIKAGRYAPGTYIYFGGSMPGWGIVCSGCKTFLRVGWGSMYSGIDCDICCPNWEQRDRLAKDEGGGGSLGQPSPLTP